MGILSAISQTQPDSRLVATALTSCSRSEQMLATRRSGTSICLAWKVTHFCRDLSAFLFSYASGCLVRLPLQTLILPPMKGGINCQKWTQRSSRTLVQRKQIQPEWTECSPPFLLSSLSLSSLRLPYSALERAHSRPLGLLTNSLGWWCPENLPSDFFRGSESPRHQYPGWNQYKHLLRDYV